MRFHRITSPAIVVAIGFLTYVALVGATANNHHVIAAEQSNDSFSPYVDSKGNISLPQDYKQIWAHLGSWAVAKKKGSDVHEMHDVYTPRENITAYNKTGKFPDGAVLVKEVRHSESKRMTTGHSAWSTDIKVWFVMIKDQQGRFEDSDHWGDGWGWALFEAKNPKKNVSVSYDSTCLSCHIPAEDTDWIYVNGYPDLKKPN
jgi:hypothetical protein